MKKNNWMIGDSIRKIREERGYTREEACGVIKLSESTISQIERGTRPVSMNALYALMEGYGVDANRILCIEPAEQEKRLVARLMKLPEDKREHWFVVFNLIMDGLEVS